MVLHRRVYLIGLLVALLAAAVAVVALIEMSSAGTQADRLARHNAQANLLSAAQRDITSSQYQYASAVALPKGSDDRRAVFVQASAQQQQGFDEWDRFRRTADDGIGSSSAATQLTASLAALPYATNRGKTASKAQTANLTAVQIAVPALQVAATFDALRRTANSRWTAELAAHRNTGGRGEVAVIIAGSLALIGVVSSLTMLARAARRRDLELADRDRDLERVARGNEFEARLQRALELAGTEDRVYAVMEQALEETAPQLNVELLLADSSRAHFQPLVSTGPQPSHRCSVDSPTHCPAAQRGEVLAFESSSALDACPYLKERQTPCSAVCVPVSVSGLTVGVVHAAGAVGAPPDAQERTTLELISRRTSDRIGMMRAFSDSKTQASTDPLTGLPNRRSLESSVRQLSASGASYAVAFGDLDHFKTVNDKYGHGAGDHALRVFARVVREQLRPDDIFGRYGGEEFLIVLPDCTEQQAADILERIRASLAVTLIGADCPSFTVSFGLALNTTGQSFEDTVRTADSALLDAKRQGRDCIVVAGPVELSRSEEPSRSELIQRDGLSRPDERESAMSQ